MDDILVAVDPASRRLIPQLRLFIRSKGLAYATGKTYIYWIVFFIRHHGIRHSGDMDAVEVDDFLSYLSVVRNV